MSDARAVDVLVVGAGFAGDVALVDIRSAPIARATPTGVALESGAHHDLDVLVFATDFDAITGSLLRPEIVGPDGVTPRERWAAGPVTYLGLGVHGLPDMVVIAGAVETTDEAERAWGRTLDELAAGTLYPRARSYSMGDEIPGRPRGFVLCSGGLRNYRSAIAAVADDEYAGCAFGDPSGARTGGQGTRAHAATDGPRTRADAQSPTEGTTA